MIDIGLLYRNQVIESRNLASLAHAAGAERTINEPP
jgi:hypothetical protein